jgi:hypothetical protein
MNFPIDVLTLDAALECLLAAVDTTGCRECPKAIAQEEQFRRNAQAKVRGDFDDPDEENLE